MFKKILVPVDMQESSFAAHALEVAIEQAKRYGGSLHVMTVVPDFGMPVVASYFPESAMQQALLAVEQDLEKFVEENVPKDVDTTLSIASGNPYKKILQAAKELDVDLITIASHDKASGLDVVLIGSVANQVVKHAHISVMVIREAGK